MAKKKSQKAKKPKPGRIVLRTGEALLKRRTARPRSRPSRKSSSANSTARSAIAIANLIGDQVKGHTRVFAILNSDVQVRPATLMVSKVTVKNEKYTNILMGTVQAAIAHGVLDAVRAGDIPKEKANDLGIIVSVWLDPSVLDAEKVDHKVLFQTNREATAKAIHKAMHNEPTIDWLLKNQDKVTHYFHQMGVKGEL